MLRDFMQPTSLASYELKILFQFFFNAFQLSPFILTQERYFFKAQKGPFPVDAQIKRIKNTPQQGLLLQSKWLRTCRGGTKVNCQTQSNLRSPGSRKADAPLSSYKHSIQSMYFPVTDSRKANHENIPYFLYPLH